MAHKAHFFLVYYGEVCHNVYMMKNTKTKDLATSLIRNFDTPGLDFDLNVGIWETSNGGYVVWINFLEPADFILNNRVYWAYDDAFQALGERYPNTHFVGAV